MNCRYGVAVLLAAAAMAAPSCRKQKVPVDAARSSVSPSLELQRLEDDAKRGNADSQALLADLYRVDPEFGVERDPGDTAVWARKAADSGHPLGRYVLAVLHEEGLGVGRDDSLANSLYGSCAPGLRRLADSGNSRAQCALATMYFRGKGVEKSPEQAVALYRASAMQGNAEAQWLLGTIYEDVLYSPTDYEEAVAWYRKAADSGHIPGRKNLGALCAALGDTCMNEKPGRSGEAVNWYLAAAKVGSDAGLERLRVMSEQKYSRAQSALADLHRTGDPIVGDSTDYSRAILLYSFAAEQGDDHAADQLAIMQLRNMGSEQEFQEAWQRVARGDELRDALFATGNENIIVQVGRTEAMTRVGQSYEEGYTVARDYDQAMAWYLRAAEEGSGRAMFHIGQMYWGGRGVESNLVKAAEWHEKAADADFAPSCNQVAWLYSVYSDPGVMNGERAVGYALKAVQAEPDNWAWVDTLAAAYARCGRFDEAVTTQNEAVQLAEDLDVSSPIISEMKQRLMLYRRHEAYFER
jgi:TPR repeat protein